MWISAVSFQQPWCFEIFSLLVRPFRVWPRLVKDPSQHASKSLKEEHCGTTPPHWVSQLARPWMQEKRKAKQTEIMHVSKIWKQGKTKLAFYKNESDKSSPGFKSEENSKWLANENEIREYWNIKPEVFIASPTPDIYRSAKHFRLPCGGVRHGPPTERHHTFFHFRFSIFWFTGNVVLYPPKIWPPAFLFKVLKEFFVEHDHPVCSPTFYRNHPRRNNRILTVQIWKLSISSVLPFHLRLFLSEVCRAFLKTS